MWRKFIYLLLTISSIGAIVQDYYWREYIPGDIPYDAFEGAPGRYIGQVNDNGNVPTTIFPYNNIAVHVMLNVKKKDTENIKILCSPVPNRFYWEYVDFNKPHDLQMKNAVKGGYQANLKISIFIGKVLHDDEWKIGEVIPMDHHGKGMWTWTQNEKEVRFYQFYILKYNLTVITSDGIVIFQS